MEIIDGSACIVLHSDRHAILGRSKHELGGEARHYNFNASSDARSIFRYRMHTLPTK